MRYTKDFIRAAQQSLPGEIRTILASDTIMNAAGEIAQATGLSITQENALSYEMMLLLLGLTKADDFGKMLVEHVGTDAEMTQKVAALVHEKVLASVPEAALHAQEEYAQAKLTEAGAAALIAPASVPEVAPEILPKALPGETAHDVPHVEVPSAAAVPSEALPASQAPAAPAPAPTAPTMPEAPKSIVEEKLSQVTVAQAPAPQPSSYPKGADPYREPIE